MILAGRQIEKLDAKVIVEGFNPKNIHPGKSVFIRTAEKIHVPADLLIRVGNRNSLIRMGLHVTGPTCFPGHLTYMFPRIENVSADAVVLRAGQVSGQLFFEQLDGVPNVTYAQQADASFQKEENYVQFGRCQQEYETRIRKIEKSNERLENTEMRIYENILT